MAPVDVRKGMPSVELSREEFEKRYRSRFADPAFEALQREFDAITAAAWDAYSNSRKSPLTRKAGPGFADPDYDPRGELLKVKLAPHGEEAHLRRLEPRGPDVAASFETRRRRRSSG